MVFALGFLVLLGAACYAAILPLAVMFIYTVMSCLTFVVFAIDKSAAKNARWRIPERQLHALSLLCGWPGALIAKQYLRHKSAKSAFKKILYLMIFINIGLLYGVLSHFHLTHY